MKLIKECVLIAKNDFECKKTQKVILNVNNSNLVTWKSYHLFAFMTLVFDNNDMSL